MLKRILFSTLFIMTGCSQYSLDPEVYPAPLSSTTDTGNRLFPAKEKLAAVFAPASVALADCPAPVDTIDGHAPTTFPYASGERVKIMGWALLGPPDPTPKRIHGAFAPYSAGDPIAVLDGKRLERSDVASGNPSHMMAGYELDGHMPDAPGHYRFFIVTGTAAALHICDTKIVITVH